MFTFPYFSNHRNTESKPKTDTNFKAQAIDNKPIEAILNVWHCVAEDKNAVTGKNISKNILLFCGTLRVSRERHYENKVLITWDIKT